MAIHTHYEVPTTPFEQWWFVMGNAYTASSSLITFTNTDGTLTKAYGTFSVINGNVIGGVISSMQHTSANGQTLIESLTGLSANVISFLAQPPQSRFHFLLGGSDQFYGYSGDDIFYGGAGQDLMIGGEGDDQLRDADGEADKLIGGWGDDTYRIDSLDTVIEAPGQGIDTIEITGTGTREIPANVENASTYPSGPSNSLHVIGNGLDNTFYNILSDSLLEGGEGHDTFRDDGDNNQLKGGIGNDTYELADVPSLHSTIVELPDEGRDTVKTGASRYELPENVEDLVFTDAGPHEGYGNGSDNWINGNAGADILYGMGGNDTFNGNGGLDTLYGGAGDDGYVVFSDGEVVEQENEGDDYVIALLSFYELPANVEDLEIHANAGVAFGNGLDNTIYAAFSGGYKFYGLGGNDKLIGSGGNDFLYGGDGDDIIKPKIGSDFISGGDGDDTLEIQAELANCTVVDLGNRVILNAFGSVHYEMTGIEHLQFADGTVHLNDGNPLFDTLYYMSHNLDVFHAGVGALDHFNAVGWQEGRDPNAFFSVRDYLDANPDVKAAGVNPLEHYHQSGWKEGRDPSANFDTTLYLINNPDVAAAGMDPLEHYLQFGMAEGRKAYAAIGQNISGGFDAQYYLMQNPDVAAAGIDPLFHYNVVGWKEGRDPNAWFDSDGYLNYYTDVKAAGINPLQHYETIGWKEGRDPSAGFDTTGYLATYTDVAAAGINPLDHFLQVGIYEGRQAVNDGMWG